VLPVGWAGTWSAAVEERLEIVSRERLDAGRLAAFLGGAEIAQVSRLPGRRTASGRVCRRDVLAEVSRPPPLPARMFENAQIDAPMSCQGTWNQGLYFSGGAQKWRL
jgi:hypothetical protein